MGFIAGFLLTYMPADDCFRMMARLLREYGLSGMFRRGFPRLQLLNYQLQELLEDRLPTLAHHLVRRAMLVLVLAFLFRVVVSDGSG